MTIKQQIVDMMPDPLVKIFAAPYVAGDNEQTAATKAQQLWQSSKIRSTADLLGEEVKNQEEIDITINSYLKLIDLLGRQEYATISLKPTQLACCNSEQTCSSNIAKVAEYAARQHIPVTVDMEDHAYTDMTLSIYKELLPRFPDLGTVLQTRLFRTADDIKALKGLKTRIRLCIGIYLEPAEIALQRKSEMKLKLLEYAEILLDDGHYVEFGTHDEALVDKLLNMIARRGFNDNQFEIQMLMGVPRERLQQQLIANGHKVRYYLPYALLWHQATAYSKRRLAANPKMALYVTLNLFRSLLQR